MINLNISQNNGLLKNVNDNIIEFLYHLSKGLDSNTYQYLCGRIEVVHGYEDAVNFLTQKFEDLYITSSEGYYIRFKDSTVEQILATNYGDQTGITVQQAAALSSDSIMRSLFKENTDITSFDELSFFINIKTLAFDSFIRCTNLTSIDLRNVTSIYQNAFNGCTSLTTVKNYQNVRHFAPNVFVNCDLTGDFDFSNANDIDPDSNDQCIGLEGNRHLKNVIMPSNMLHLCKFTNCNELETLTGLDGVIDLPYDCFMNCYNLQNLSLPNVVSAAQNIFVNANTMTLISLPNLETCDYNFINSCENLEEAYLPSLQTCNRNNMFYNNPKLRKITVGTWINPLEDTYIPDGCFNNCVSLTELVMGDFSTIKKMKARAFNCCKALTTTFNFPNVTEIGEECYRGCSSLTTIELPKLESIGRYCFAECNALTNISLPHVKEVEVCAFYNCKNLITASLPSLTTFGKKIGNNTYFTGVTLFYGCSKLKEVTVGSLTSIPEFFVGEDSKLEKVYTADGTNILHPTSIGRHAFRNCELVECTIDLANVTFIDEGAFNNCKKMTFINADQMNVENIYNSTFYACYKLGEIDLSHTKIITGAAFCEMGKNFKIKNNDLTSIEEIGSWPFNNTRIGGILDLGANIRKIGAEPFNHGADCDIILRCPQMPDTSTGWRNIYVDPGHFIYVLDELLDDYKAAWADIASCFKPISELPE